MAGSEAPSEMKTPALFSSCPGTDFSPLYPMAFQKRHKGYAHEDVVLHHEIILPGAAVRINMEVHYFV
jgi:hypothetical protein